MTENQQAAPEKGEGLPNFVTRALRRKMPGSYEQLLCQHLIKSVAAEPMEKIRLVSEAAYMVQDTPVDQDVLDVIFNVANSFMNMNVVLDQYLELYWGKIAWSFKRNKENYEKYILPWLFSLDRLRWVSGDGPSYDVRTLEPWQFFFAVTTDAKIWPSSLEWLKASFISWAMPQAMTIFEQLSRLVSPDLYEAMLGKMKT